MWPTDEQIRNAFNSLTPGRPALMLLVYREEWPSDPTATAHQETIHARVCVDTRMKKLKEHYPQNIELIGAGLQALGQLHATYNGKLNAVSVRVVETKDSDELNP